MFILTPDDPLPIPLMVRVTADLRLLADDIERPAGGAPVDAVRLAAAPVIDHYGQVITPTPALAGLVSGHSVLPGHERAICTSTLWLVNEAEGWVRTQSQFYRLGVPRDGDAPPRHRRRQ